MVVLILKRSKEQIKLIEEYKAKNVKVRLRAVGRKGIDFFKFNGVELNDEIIGLSAAPDFKQAAEFISEWLNHM